MCYPAKLVHSQSDGMSVITEIRQKILTSHVPPFMVTGTDFD